MMESRVGLEKKSSLFRVSLKMYQDLDTPSVCIHGYRGKDNRGFIHKKKEVAPAIWGW